MSVFAVLSFIDGIKSSNRSIERKIVLELLMLPSLIFFLPLVGYFFSEYKPAAASLMIKYLPFLLLSLSFIYSKEGVRKDAHKYISSGIILGVLLSLIYLFIKTFYLFYMNNEENLHAIFSYKYTYNRFLAPLNLHPTYFSVLIIISNYFIYNSNLLKKIKCVLLLINLLGLIFIMSRIGILVYFFQVFALLFFLKKRISRIIYVSSFIAVLTGIVILYNYKIKDIYLFQRLSLELAWDLNYTNNNSSVNNREFDDSRLARWAAIAEAIKEKPFFGYGSGSEREVLDAVYRKNELYHSLERKYNTHNQYLFYLIENGIVGLSLIILFIVGNFVKAYKNKDYFSCLFLITVIAVCFAENYFNRTMGVLTISIFMTYMKSNYG
ncbi:O-antigen ligase family protein [Sinomicrobium oceani]|uniref:O-antigen ligase family protein n=1 Tax=Sinomicrobium oceani TaxID=1150368 RepID=UPI00227B6E9F|nr:O-antigen ligase family protein [Sinomicrobium oceani]